MSTPQQREPWRIDEKSLARIHVAAPRGFVETVREGVEAAVALGIVTPVVEQPVRTIDREALAPEIKAVANKHLSAAMKLHGTGVVTDSMLNLTDAIRDAVLSFLAQPEKGTPESRSRDSEPLGETLLPIAADARVPEGEVYLIPQNAHAVFDECGGVAFVDERGNPVTVHGPGSEGTEHQEVEGALDERERRRFRHASP